MYTLLSAIVKIVGLLPLKARTFIGQAVGYFFSYLPTKERRVASLQLDFILGPEKKQAILPGVYGSLCQTLFEALNLLPFLSNLERYVEIENEEVLTDVIGSKGGAILLSAHTANWELLAAIIIKKGLPLSTVGRKARNELFQKLLLNLRNRYGLHTHWRDESGSSIAIIRKLRRGEGLGALIDQDTDVRSEFVPFFGLLCRTPSVLIELGRKCDAKFLATFIFRTAPSRYKASFHDLGSGTVEEILQRYHTLLERGIREYPEQWVWFHKRWRSLPDGRRMKTAEYLKYLSDKLAKNALIFMIIVFLGCTVLSSPLTHLERAEECSRENKFEKAISEYEKHIQYRLALEERPEWENPYFYYLIIGDLYLRKGDVARSLASYELAELHGVDLSLVTDRFRMVSHWYEKQELLQKAVEILTKYRERDPLMFDDVLDRLSKELVRQQDSAASQLLQQQ